MSRASDLARAGLAPRWASSLLSGAATTTTAAASTKNAPLFEFNASTTAGRTVRWPNLPIRVFLGNGVARTDEVTAWTEATGGAVTFTFVGSARRPPTSRSTPAASDPDICGMTDIVFDGDGHHRRPTSRSAPRSTGARSACGP